MEVEEFILVERAYQIYVHSYTNMFGKHAEFEPSIR